MEGPALSWDALPFGAIAATILHVQRLPPHQAASALGAARLLCRHWRQAVDDAMTEWDAAGSQPGALAAMLSRWRHLRRFSLNGGQLDEAVLDALSRCLCLERISLWGVNMPTQQLCGVLAQLPRLAEVEFSPPDRVPGNASIAALAGCTALRSLSLESVWGDQWNTAGDVVVLLRGATGLQHLGLDRTVRTMASQAQQALDIGFAVQLTSLQLRASYTTYEAFLELFGSLTRLRRLDISSNPNLGDDGFLGITRLAGSLRELVMEGGHAVSEDGATALAALTGLQSLSLGFSHQMSRGALLPLVAGKLHQLTHLDIRGCHRACSPGPFSHLTQLQRLRRLVAKGCGLQQASVRTLAALPSLAELDLEDNPGLMALGELRSLSELQRLDVGHCWLEDAHLAPLLASLPQLQHVALDENQQLTVAVVEALAAGPAASSLQHLLAASLDLEWAALLPLLPQFSALEHLSLAGNAEPVDPEALLPAAEAAPALCSIDVQGVRLTSDAGWRRMMQGRRNAGRRRLLHILPWDLPFYAEEVGGRA